MSTLVQNLILFFILFIIIKIFNKRIKIFCYSNNIIIITKYLGIAGTQNGGFPVDKSRLNIQYWKSMPIIDVKASSAFFKEENFIGAYG